MVLTKNGLPLLAARLKESVCLSQAMDQLMISI